MRAGYKEKCLRCKTFVSNKELSKGYSGGPFCKDQDACARRLDERKRKEQLEAELDD